MASAVERSSRQSQISHRRSMPSAIVDIVLIFGRSRSSSTGSTRSTLSNLSNFSLSRALSKKFSLSLGRDPLRRKFIWFAGCGTMFVLTAPLLWKDTFCPATDPKMLWDSTDKSFRNVLCIIAMPWIAAITLMMVVDHRGRYDRRLACHRWTWYFVVLSALANLEYLLWVWLRAYFLCRIESGGRGLKGAAQIYHKILNSGFFACSLGALAYSQVLKLDSIAGAVRAETGMLVVAVVSCIIYTTLTALRLHIPALVCFVILMVGANIFMFKVSRRFFKAARDAEAQVVYAALHERDAYRASARMAKWTALAMALSFVSTDAFVCLWSLEAQLSLGKQAKEHDIPDDEIRALVAFWDLIANSCCSLVLSGLVGPRIDVREKLDDVAHLVAAARERAIQAKLLSAMSSGTGAAVTLAAMLSRKDTVSVIAEARSRFRSLSWQTLRSMPEIICAAGTNGQSSPSIAHLHALSEPCDLGECDVFLSHSWHDDPRLKWTVLWTWCEEFTAAHGRAPRLWLDKVCINQNDIVADLAYLPVFLAGCKALLILSGPTYTSRLWCALELFVFMTIRDLDEHAQSVILLYAALDTEQRNGIRNSWLGFTAANCKCVDPDNKKKIMEIISQSHGGMEQFDNEVIQMARTVSLENHDPLLPQRIEL